MSLEEIEKEIEECKEALADLERVRDEAIKLRDKIHDEVEEPEKSFDMTVSDEYRGVLEIKAEDEQNEINGETVSAQGQTDELIRQIKEAIEKIKERLSYLKEKRDALLNCNNDEEQREE